MQIIYKNGLKATKGHPGRSRFSWPFVSLLAVFVPALALRFFFLAVLDTDLLFNKYPWFAEKLASGEPIGTRLADLSPSYLYLLTLFRWLLPIDWAALKVIQALVGALNCWLTAIIARQIFNNRAIGITSGLIPAAYGNLIILETTLEPTVFVICFNLLAVYFLYRHFAQDDITAGRRYRHLILSALFTGVAIITKPSFLLFLPLAGLWIMLKHGRQAAISQIITALLLFGSIACVPVLAVTVRNHVLLEDTILVTADAGKVFFHGNSKHATVVRWAGIADQGLIEEAAVEPDYAHAAFRNLAARLSGRELKPSEASKFWARRTWADIGADPGRYFRLLGHKFLFFFSNYELHYISAAYREYKHSLAFPFVGFAWIIPLGILGMLLGANRIGHLLPLYGLVGLYVLSGMIFIVQSRYRIPAVPYLAMFGALALYRFSLWLQAKQAKRVLAAMVFLSMGYIFSNTVLQKEISTTDRWFQATKIHYETGARIHFRSGQYLQAVEEATRALALEPAFGPAYNLRGKSYALLTDYRAAIADFKKVIQLHPGHAEGYRNLGFAYLIEKDHAAARMYLEKALGLNKNDRKVTAALERLSAADTASDPGRP